MVSWVLVLYKIPCPGHGEWATIEGVKSVAEGDKLHIAQIENRHLQNTIQALRDELEAMRSANEAAVQAAVASGSNEARQLHATIGALRTELEQTVFRQAGEIEQARRAAHDELRSLRETVAALRENLENRPA